jgi:hypothetical protein
VTGAGLVLLVTPEVNAFRSPSTLLEKPCTPVTTEAANAEPGMLIGDLLPEEGMDGPDPAEDGW